ncbi:blue light receptor, partial [Physocladia obscura]
MEGQFTLVNYRKSGEPFVNFITIVPLFTPGSNIVEFFVGFQVDLIQQPRTILLRHKEGTYITGFKNPDEYAPREIDPRGIILYDASPHQQQQLSHQNLITLPHGMADPITNSSDLLFILSLRARFLHVSPSSCRNLLGWDTTDLVGKKLQEYIHPADLLSVLRELRGAKFGRLISFLCRFRAFTDEYIYQDVVGHMHDGNNKKCFVLFGRQYPVPQSSITGESLTTPLFCPSPNRHDLWAKISLQGLILFASSINFSYFGLKPCNKTILIGTSVHDLMVPADQSIFNQCLSTAIETKQCSYCFVRVGETLKQTKVCIVPEPGNSNRHLFVRMWPYTFGGGNDGSENPSQVKRNNNLDGQNSDGNIGIEKTNAHGYTSDLYTDEMSTVALFSVSGGNSLLYEINDLK